MISEKSIAAAQDILNTYFEGKGEIKTLCLLSLMLLSSIGQLSEQLDTLQSSVNNLGKWGNKL